MDITYSDNIVDDDWIALDNDLNRLVQDKKESRVWTTRYAFNPSIVPKPAIRQTNRYDHFNQLMSDTDLLIASNAKKIR